MRGERQTKRKYINDILQDKHLEEMEQGSTKVNDNDELGDQSTLKVLQKERRMNVVRCQLGNSS